MKIVTVIGARPQFVKAAAVSRAIAEYNNTVCGDDAVINEIIVHTGQHFDANMSDIFFEEMLIPQPHYHLEIHSLSHGAMTGRMLEQIEAVLLREKPDYVMVYGDTNSTLAGALAASKLHIKVIHVEAGLRSFNLKMPEEINRILTDRISDILCCPTETAIGHLKHEGINTGLVDKVNHPLVVETGDVMLDAALYYSKLSQEKSTLIKDLRLDGKDFVLCTIHRAENTDDPERLKAIFAALREISKEMRVVLPLHPRTRKILETSNATVLSDNSSPSESLIIIDPVGYFDMLELLKQTSMVMTDSGGLQKEAYFFGNPCVVLRDETEWTELVELGYNVLAGATHSSIVNAYNQLSNRTTQIEPGIYGNGEAAHKIIDALQRGNPASINTSEFPETTSA